MEPGAEPIAVVGLMMSHIMSNSKEREEREREREREERDQRFVGPGSSAGGE
jgi:hypothetical protein